MTQTFLKDFGAWAKVAQRVEQHSYPAHIQVGAVYWCHLGINIGSELLGKGPEFTRPVLILAKPSERFAIIVPLTSRNHHGAHYIELNIAGKLDYLALGHITTIDTKRIIDFIDEVDEQTFKRIKNPKIV